MAGAGGTGGVVLLAVDRLVLVQRREGVDAHAQDMLLDVAHERLELVRRVQVRRDREHYSPTTRISIN